MSDNNGIGYKQLGILIVLSLWKENFWSRSYCLLTTGGSPIEVVKKYIQNQGEK